MKTSRSSLIDKNVFIRSSETLLVGFAELSVRMLVDTLVRKGMEQVQELPDDAKKVLSSLGAGRVSTMSKDGFAVLTRHLDESYVTLSYSWLEAYLSVAEEALYLHDPRSLGDNIQIKLGKVLAAESIAELIHDAAKRRVRDKGAWGLRNRIVELKTTYRLKIPQSDEELEEISKARNDLVHGKRIGEFKIYKGRITYAHRSKGRDRPNIESYLDKVCNLAIDLFCESSKALRIDRRNRNYRRLENACEAFRDVFKNSSNGVTSA